MTSTGRLVHGPSDTASGPEAWPWRDKAIDSDWYLACALVAARRIAPIRPAFGLKGDDDWEVT